MNLRRIAKPFAAAALIVGLVGATPAVGAVTASHRPLHTQDTGWGFVAGPVDTVADTGWGSVTPQDTGWGFE